MAEHCLNHAAHEIRIEGLERTTNAFSEDLGEFLTMHHAIDKRVELNEQTMELIEGKVDKMEMLTEAVNRMSFAIEYGNAESKRQIGEVLELLSKHTVAIEQQGIDIAELKLAPAKLALRGWKVVAGLVVAAFVGGMITAIANNWIARILG